MTSLADLLQEQTPAQALETLLARLASGDDPFPVTSWQSGSVPRTLLNVVSYGFSDFAGKVSAIARGGLLDLAEKGWLTLLAASTFRVQRRLAGFAMGSVSLTCASPAGPYNITPGGLLVTDGVRRWRSINTTTTAVSSGSTVSIGVQAEAAGTDYNAAAGTITRIVTPAGAGLTVTNPSDWLVKPGTAEETDAALRQRCRDRWSTLGRGATVAAYRYLATTAPDGTPYAAVTRAAVILGPGDGTLRVIVAGAPTVPGGDLATITSSLLERAPATDAPSVEAATVVTVTITATVYVRSGFDSTANRALATTAIANYFLSLDIGGTVDREALAAAIYTARGISDVDIAAPSGDTSLAGDEVATPSVALTWVTV